MADMNLSLPFGQSNRDTNVILQESRLFLFLNEYTLWHIFSGETDVVFEVTARFFRSLAFFVECSVFMSRMCPGCVPH